MTAVVHFTATGEHCGEACPADHAQRPTLPPLYQDQIWTTREGEVLFIEEMTPRHAHYSYWFLHKRAAGLAWKYSLAEATGPFAPMGDMATDAMEAEHDERAERPHTWLDTQEQTRALALRALDYYQPRPLPWRCEEPPPGKPDPADSWIWRRSMVRSNDAHAQHVKDRGKSMCGATLDLRTPLEALPHVHGRCKWCLRAIAKLSRPSTT